MTTAISLHIGPTSFPHLITRLYVKSRWKQAVKKIMLIPNPIFKYSYQGLCVCKNNWIFVNCDICENCQWHDSCWGQWSLCGQGVWLSDDIITEHSPCHQADCWGIPHPVTSMHKNACKLFSQSQLERLYYYLYHNSSEVHTNKFEACILTVIFI